MDKYTTSRVYGFIAVSILIGFMCQFWIPLFFIAEIPTILLAIVWYFIDKKGGHNSSQA
jgi:hypothetical protein